jgi:hypothetical protein
MNTKSQITSLVVLVIGFILGTSAFYSLAAFQGPPANAPECDGAIYPGCNPLINTSDAAQTKKGILKLRADRGDNSGLYELFGLEVMNGIKLIDRANIATAKDMVLTSNAAGIGTWKPLPNTGGYDGVSSEVSVKSTNNKKSIAIAPSTPQWPSCMVTKSTFTGSGAFNNYCAIANTNDEWVLTAYANTNGTESSDCSAICIGYSVNPYQPSCTTPKSSYRRGETFQWTTTIPIAGDYMYIYSSNNYPTGSIISVTYSTPGSVGHKDESVSVYKQDGTFLGTSQCINNQNGALGTNII